MKTSLKTTFGHKKRASLEIPITRRYRRVTTPRFTGGRHREAGRGRNIVYPIFGEELDIELLVDIAMETWGRSKILEKGGEKGMDVISLCKEVKRQGGGS